MDITWLLSKYFILRKWKRKTALFTAVCLQSLFLIYKFNNSCVLSGISVACLNVKIQFHVFFARVITYFNMTSKETLSVKLYHCLFPRGSRTHFKDSSEWDTALAVGCTFEAISLNYVVLILCRFEEWQWVMTLKLDTVHCLGIFDVTPCQELALFPFFRWLLWSALSPRNVIQVPLNTSMLS